MSVKIYDGLRATEADLFSVASKLRAVLEREFVERFRGLTLEARRLLEEKGEITWDEAFFVDGKLGEKPIKALRLEHDLYQVIKALDEASEYTFSSANIAYTVQLLPNAAGGNPLVLVFGEQAEGYRTLLKEAGLVEDYGYWDNSDPDEAVSEAEWEERERAWAHLFNAAPDEIGLGFRHPSSITTQVRARALT